MDNAGSTTSTTPATQQHTEPSTPKPADANQHDLPLTPAELEDQKLRRLFLKLSCGVIFLILFQTYMIAPLIPSMARDFGVSVQKVGMLVPAYTLPYAAAGLFCGALAMRLGRRVFYFLSLLGFPILSLLLAFSPSLNSLLGIRFLAGLCNSGLVVMTLIVVGDRFPINRRGWAVGWVFGAIAGGSAIGSSFAGIISPLLGWRGLFAVSALMGLLLAIPLLKVWPWMKGAPAITPSWGSVAMGYFALLKLGRARRTFLFIFLNGVFHAGTFTWLGVHLYQRYGLGDVGIGLALLGYGIPGFVLSPMIGSMADRMGRRFLIPAGFFVAAAAAFLFAPHLPLIVAILLATVLSVGFDLTHPLLAGIALGLNDERRGQAMGLNTFAIFCGFGIGSLLFGMLVGQDTAMAFIIFGIAQCGFGLASIYYFANE